MPKQKLTNEQKQIIVERFKAGEPMTCLAKEYGVSLRSEVKKLVIHSMLHLMGYVER